MAEQRLSGVADGVFFLPYDYAWMVRRALRRLRPAAVVVLETEIWPNLWREAKRFGATLMILNGRISDRAWPRYRRFRWFFAPLLRLPDLVLAQSATDCERFRELGVSQPRTETNLKYDFAAPREIAADLREWIAAQGWPRIFIAASTMPPNEEEIVIDAWQKMPPDTLLILAPRRPERFALASQLLETRGIPFARRTQLAGTARVLLLDTIGELASLFALDAVVFVGGSIVTWGGHNVLEPAFFGRPIITGPHMQNFAAIDAEFRAAAAVRSARDAAELAAVARELFEDPGELGLRAETLARSRQGVTRRVAAAVALGAPLTHPPLAWLLRPLQALWLWGVALDRLLTRRLRLPKPVISIGGIAMGGVGKTPVVLALAQQLHQAGYRVGILTRGYGRRERRPLVLAAGESAPVEQTGDEAQLYLRAKVACVGIGSDRYANGMAMADRVDVFLLDDGFQHWRLERDLDVVLTDPLDPHSGGGVFPAGRLREPPSALRRASLVLSPQKTAIDPPPPGDYDAFCGIGNPGSFLATLRRAGVTVRRFRAFPDHHRYRREDLHGLKDPLLTTAKDAANLPAGAPPVRVVEAGVDAETLSVLFDRVVSVVRRSGPLS